MKKVLSCLSLALLSAYGTAQDTNGLKVNESFEGSKEIQNFVQSNGQSGSTSLFLATEYCTPSSSSSSTFINSFTTSGGQLNITNVSTGYAVDGYADNTSSVVQSFAGGSFGFNAEMQGGTAGFAIWVDWNKDFEFDNETERVYTTTTYTAGPFVGEVLIPDSVEMGDYRMRIAIDYYSAAPLFTCGDRSRAEFEDFTLRIGDAPSCPNPSQLTADNITGTTADLSWSFVGNTSAWNIQYGVAGFSLGSGTMATSDTNSYTVTGLNGTTEYEYYVQSNCGSETSDWVGPYSFTTDCLAFVPNYEFDFSSFELLENCWSWGFGGTPQTGPESVNVSLQNPWYEDGFLNNGEQGAIRFNYYYNTKRGWLITPAFDLSGGGDYEIRFDYGLTQYNNAAPGNLGSDDEFKLLMSEDGGATWTELQTWTAADNISNTSNHYARTISSTSPNVKFAFYTTEGTVDDPEDVDLFFDNVKVMDRNLATSEVAIKDLEGVQVYPNPFTDVLNITDVKGVEKITVSDMSGRVVKTFEATNTLQLGNLNSGLYLISLSYEDGSVKTIKAIKK